MKKFDEDLTIKELDYPPLGHWCDSGHKAPEFFRRQGPDSNLEPTRFVTIIGDDYNKTICEPCLMVANHLARLKKEKKRKRENYFLKYQ